MTGMIHRIIGKKMSIPIKLNPAGINKHKYIPLTFTAKQANSTIRLTITNGNPVVEGLQYKKNNGIWKLYVIDTVITLYNINDYVQFQNNRDNLSVSLNDSVKFIMTGTIQGSGTIQSLLNYSEYCKPCCYYHLFSGCKSLTVSPQLDAKFLASQCYLYMFDGCTGLINPPELNSMYLAGSCYNAMFVNCTSLQRVPALPATQLYNLCYLNMFFGCSSLITVPSDLLPSMNLAQNCYYSMFTRCINLTNAPDLPAVNLSPGCYHGMFSYCRSLRSIKVDFTNWGNNNQTYDWVNEVAQKGTFYKPKSLSEEYGPDRIPDGWDVVEF